MGPYKPREVHDEFYYLVETFIKKLKNGLDGGLFGNGMKILEVLRENRLKFVGK